MNTSIFNWLKSIAILFCISIIVLSCKKDTEDTVKMRVNIFKQTNYSFNKGFHLSVQVEETIGTDTWYALSQEITGFNYEPGYLYDLLLEKVPLSQAADGPAYGYKLKKIKSKRRANSNDTFTTVLKFGYPYSAIPYSFVNGDLNTGFMLANQVKIDCGNLCSELESALKNYEHVIGKFTLNANGSIKLVALETR
ncbi:DUF4377 domain-containing protein [Pedobacter sp. Hv1]|uniref:DUF4377 domain-containing protein n=1 Tax=Pedobacter sp. Hv1 TaxID=1740090 RepID=UPI0006D88B9C|nr:DUF4377 domain-containing protein [Pedobacter sp. Hv1]KQC02166.1 hypothetical protein AQF98_00910 [Pedobacter sp. Hv1]